MVCNKPPKLSHLKQKCTSLLCYIASVGQQGPLLIVITQEPGLMDAPLQQMLPQPSQQERGGRAQMSKRHNFPLPSSVFKANHMSDNFKRCGKNVHLTKVTEKEPAGICEET